MPPISFDNYIEGLAKLALSLPQNELYYTRPTNRVREFLLDVADCIRAAAKQQTVRKDALVKGMPAPECAATPAGRAATTEGK